MYIVHVLITPYGLADGIAPSITTYCHILSDFVSNMVGYDTLSRIYEQMCSYSRAWTYTLNRQATYEWTYSLLSISNAMDYPTHYFMPSIDSFYDERLCQSPTRICTKMLIDDCSESHVVCANLIDTTFLLNEPRFPNFKV